MAASQLRAVVSVVLGSDYTPGDLSALTRNADRISRRTRGIFGAFLSARTNTDRRPRLPRLDITTIVGISRITVNEPGCPCAPGNEIRNTITREAERGSMAEGFGGQRIG